MAGPVPPEHAGSAGAGDEAGLDPAVLARMVAALDADDRAAATAIAHDLHYSELARLFGLLTADRRAALVDALRPAFPAEIFAELDETLRDEVAGQLGTDDLARTLANLDTDDALYLIDGLEETTTSRCIRRPAEPSGKARPSSIWARMARGIACST